MLLTRYGLREWLTITIVALIVALALGFLWSSWAAVPVIVLWLAVILFFRDPWRKVPTELPVGAMLSPADGVISAIEQVQEHPATKGPAVIIRIFLSVLNVHLNRAPCDCEVVSLTHTPGKYLNAQTEESARVNEANLIVLRFDQEMGGELFGVKQIAGMIARRIVCSLSHGDRLQRGMKFGMIKFGSTTELILPRPDDVTVLVEKGQKVKAGLTHLATLSQKISN